MFFFLSKLIWFFIQPLGLVLLALLLVTAGFLFRSRRLARRLVIALTLAFAAVCVLPVGDLLMLPLENRFEKPDRLPATLDGIIVLGGPEQTGAVRRPRRADAERWLPSGCSPPSTWPGATRRRPWCSPAGWAIRGTASRRNRTSSATP